MLALVDARYKLAVLDVGSYGRNSDGGIFAHSKLGKYLETHLSIAEDKQLPRTSCLAPHAIVGLEAFPLKIYLMSPYPGSQSKGDSQNSIFSYWLSRSRSVVENVFGILSQKFQNMKREDQQDATIRCLLLTSVSTCFGHHYAHLQENKGPVTAFGVLFRFCWMWLVAVLGRCLAGCEHYEVEQKS